MDTRIIVNIRKEKAFTAVLHVCATLTKLKIISPELGAKISSKFLKIEVK